MLRTPHNSGSGNQKRLFVEWLEDRTAPATFSVDTFADTADCLPGDGAAWDITKRTSLRAAIQEGNAQGGNHEILIPVPIDTNQTITLTKTLDTLTANFKIIGAGTAGLTITRGNDGVVGLFHVAASSTSSIAAINITGGLDSVGKGGAINNLGKLTVDSCTINMCTAVEGGGIDNTGTLTVINTHFNHNTTITGRGGAINNTAKLTVAACTFTSNEANQARGGAIAGWGAANSVTVADSTFQYNQATGGGAIYMSEGTLMLTGDTIADNKAHLADRAGGGGVYCQGTITIRDVTFLRNEAASNGGAVHVGAPSTVEITRCTFANNQCNTANMAKPGVGPNVSYRGLVDFTLTDNVGLNPNEPVVATN